MVQELHRPYRNGRYAMRCLRSVGCGYTVLWSLWEGVAPALEPDEAPEVIRFIRVDRLRYCGNEWGYRSTVDTQGPVEVSCPLSWLAMTTAPEDDRYEREWRQRVRAWHAMRGTGVRLSLKVGDALPLRSGAWCRVVSVKPLKIQAPSGWTMPVRRSQIDFVALATGRVPESAVVPDDGTSHPPSHAGELSA